MYSTPALMQDVRAGLTLTVEGHRMIEGRRWALATHVDGSVWAYAPKDIVFETGEAARMVRRRDNDPAWNATNGEW